MERGFSTGVHSLTVNIWHTAHIRDVGRSENPGVAVLFCGHNLPSPSPVEIGLTDLPKSGGHDIPGTPRDDRPASNSHSLFHILTICC